MVFFEHRKGGTVINSNQITTIGTVQFDGGSGKCFVDINLSDGQIFTFQDSDMGELEKKRKEFISLLQK